MTRISDPFYRSTAAHAADAARLPLYPSRARVRVSSIEIPAASAASAADGATTGAPKSEIRSSLTRHLPQSPVADDELYAMRRAAWRKQGIAVLRVAEIGDDWLRTAVVNEANRLYGRKEKS